MGVDAWAGRRVLVTGAAGFIGSHVVERALAGGADVVGVDDFDPYYARATKERNLAEARAPAPEKFHLLECDILDLPARTADVGRVDAVIHLAARAGVRPSIGNPRAYLRTNVEGTQAVLDAARAMRVPVVVMGSSSSVYGDDTPVPFQESARADAPISPYAASKRAAELVCHVAAHLHGLRIPVLRFFTVYGPRVRPDLAVHLFAQRILEGEGIDVFGDGSTARDYTYVDDIVDGVMAAWRHAEAQPAGWVDIFNLGGAHVVKLHELLALLERHLGRPARRNHVPLPPGDVHLTSADVSRARDVLGWQPRVDMDEGIRRFATWYRSVHLPR